ncbi:hypothetical protein [Ulvibacterium marinum]|uniref:Uncharacterized protein n=1 Tax=Ulvibacterium marinum TaxID=2419782 RepID=A0A3B0CAA2_9FLAO|nr:hypothetical protein [Ulvibacterium marinum]RKN81524.1 hypothetical protein D7Z94_11465 [Ulvibacterium marinum]
MSNDSKERKAEKIEELNWQNEADSELNSSEWFGAIIRYFWHLGRRKFDSFYNQKELKKNAIIGWLFKMIVIFILIYIGYRYI